ncbi:aminoglycoside phosphotransferase [Halobacillus andaensis]|uniref:Aminoglycoside phosphotransferase n=1 Tax=Halobacillus andaensis TaxID=1176239 RepID=A0A917BB91_HALAA|nr:phosphotransferase family protein [Halobacillus andaensis]MBP2005213.1 aminoglycoside phosphotransferase (APT) family kinase protein [Halobacillus andaensis]GGF29724.1 aminoglycoside phosphotransferase [Halobacillus andaensis]
MAELTKQDREEINWDGVKRLLERQIPEAKGELKVRRFSAGYSNITYSIEVGDWKGVLRRPPFGEIPPRAHDMEREFKILEKIHPVFPLAPKPYVYSENPSLMDKHFYVMELKDGVVIDDQLPAHYEDIEGIRKIVSEAVVDSLVKLHSIDIYEHQLDDLGKPDGFLERQVKGWIKRYNRAKTHDYVGVEEVETWLLQQLPESPFPTLVHNDFKLNNMMFSKEQPGEVTGVFDWELSTIGDPLTDVGAALAYWTEPEDPDTGLTAVTKEEGFLTRKQMLELYAERSGRDVSQINFYLVFSFYKIASILQQIYARWSSGELQDDRFANLDQGISNLMKKAEEARRHPIYT